MFKWASMLVSTLFVLPAGAQEHFGHAPRRQGSAISFPYKDGWLGGDAAYSVAVSPTKSVWLFGDSFVNPSAGEQRNEAKDRRGAKMVRNSVGVSTLDPNAGWQIEYFWGSASD